MKIGVLALQGAFREHATMFRRLGVDAAEIRLPGELDHIDGLVIPGGESTTMRKLMDIYSFAEPVADLSTRRIPIFGTCAGAILLSCSDSDPGLLNLMDLRVSRNAYGRQIDSRETDILLSFSPDVPFHAIFIRAPIIDDTGPEVSVLARYRDRPVLARQDYLLAATFHPELTGDERIHRYFADMVEESLSTRREVSDNRSKAEAC